MSPHQEQRFPWRAVLLFALAFGLIGLGLLFGSHDRSSATTHWMPAPAEFMLLLRVLLVGALILAAAFLGSWFGYLRVAFRLRRISKTHDHPVATRKT